MPALLVNIKIDRQEKLNLFKVTLADLRGLFDECHIKIRGALAQECIEYAKLQFESGARFYQELQEADWVAATLVMLTQVKSRSIFLYFEDHKLVAPPRQLKQVLAEFDECQLDYLCYSFFRASQLDGTNLLPLGGRKKNTFHEFRLDRSRIELLSKISPGYYTFSLLSIVSARYFQALLQAANRRRKVYNRVVAAILMRLFPYPRYRRGTHALNCALQPFDLALCIYPPASPFNLEKIWFESDTSNPEGWTYGVALQELLVNYDDDNGAYGESLIKRGLYPFDVRAIGATGLPACAAQRLCLEPGELFDCTYHSHRGRISQVPRVEISVVVGKVSVRYQGAEFQIAEGGCEIFYSNLGPIIHCVERAEIQIKVFDEAF